MNADQVLAYVRATLAFVGGYFVTKGWLDNGTVATATGAILQLVALAWSWYTHRTVVSPPDLGQDQTTDKPGA